MTCIDALEKSAALCAECLEAGNKILLCGNGGSAADSQHIAAEFVGRFMKERKGTSCNRSDDGYIDSYGYW